MRLVVYGDFNCPYSYLASERCDALVEQGLAEVDWRAVEHDRELAVPTRPADTASAAALAREVDDVRGQLAPGEAFTIQPPPFQPNSGAAIAAYAAASPGDANQLRRRLFRALWVEGADLADPAVLEGIVGTEAVRAASGDGDDDDASARLASWRDEWLGLDKRLVPMLVLPDGYVSRGLGALARLAKLGAG